MAVAKKVVPGVRKVVNDVALYPEMKKYRLVSSMATPFSRKKARRDLTEGPQSGAEADEEIDTYQFRIRYGVDREIGGKTVRVLKALRKCPIITIPVDGIVQTENPEAQQMIRLQRAPNKTLRNEVARTGGLMFEEYTGSDEADVDLDLHLV